MNVHNTQLPDGERIDPVLAHWAENLSGKKPPIHASEPHCGSYRMKAGGNYFAVVLVPAEDFKLVEATSGYQRPDRLVCVTRPGDRAPDSVNAAWLRLARHPIPEDVCQHYFEHGTWPGAAAATAEPEAPESGTAAPPAPAEGGPGHNSGDILQRATAHAQHVAEWAERNAQILTQTQADACGNLLSDTRTLATQVDAARTLEKKPHLDAGRAVDDKYRPFLQALEIELKKLRNLAAAWKDAEDARIERERAEAERLRAEAEAKRAAELAEAEATGEAPPLELAPPLPDVPEPEPVRIGGSSGRRIGFRTLKSVKVVDFSKAYRLKAVREHANVRAAIEAACNELYDQKGKVPSGCQEVKQTVAS
jgi:cell division septum initiation protein DivIVA